MVAITVNQKVFERLKQAYAEKFGGSPKLLIDTLNHVYHDTTNNSKDVISDKTIRNFFKNTEPMKMQEKNLNFLCGVLLECESYQEALRQQAALEQVEQTNPRLNEEWLDCYQEHIRKKWSTMKVLTMTQPVQLDSIYAKVNVLEVVKAKKHKTIDKLLDNHKTIDELWANIFSESISLSPLNYVVSQKNVAALDAVKRYKKLLIWGRPGAGKTTFLKHLALHYVKELGEQMIPVFIDLKVFAEEEEKPNLIDVIEREFLICVPEPAQLVQELLQQGHCLILLDGFDEIVETERNRVYRNINDFVEQFSKNHFVLTCRFGASESTFEHFTEVEMADFNEEQVYLFVRKWFASCSEQKLGDKFLEELKINRSIKDLSKNPLLLTMLCLVFEDNYDFPKNRDLLIDEAVNILIRKWDASRRVDHSSINKFNLPYRRKINLLGKIAYEAFNQESPKFFWQQRELEELIRNYIENIPEIPTETLALDSLAVLKTIETNHGLLLKQSNDFYSFSHLSFQEYFVASYIVENQNPEILEEVIKRYLTNRQWREVFLIIAGRLLNADDFFKLIFTQINKLVDSKPLQELLVWLYNVTALHKVESSSWRAFYLLVDQWFELYTNCQTKIDYNLAQQLAIMLKDLNLERDDILKPSPLNRLAFDLVKTHAQVSAKFCGDEFKPQKITPLLKKALSMSDNMLIAPQLRDRVETLDKEKGILTINKQVTQELDKKIQDIAGLDDRFQDVKAHLEERNISDNLKEELIFLLESFPGEDDPKEDWKQWTNSLRAAMMLYLDIGFAWKFSEADIKTFKDYLYANILLIECIRGGSYCSKHLRNQIVDHLLLPIKNIPETLGGCLQST
ncbi:NACHT domain-containing protein [Scytonema tolypothrichoides VB-61278]|nr:NACHT domain-containing protein [Scytonema tolypothrichoides VB-61278]